MDDICLARWTLDDRVYEAVIAKVDKKRKKVTVRFVGYGNEETVPLAELLASKGEEWREGQEIDAERPEEEDVELNRLLEDGDCNDLMAQLNQSIDTLAIGPDLVHEVDVVVEKEMGNRKQKKERAVKNKSEKKRIAATKIFTVKPQPQTGGPGAQAGPLGGLWESLPGPEPPGVSWPNQPKSFFPLPPLPPAPAFPSHLPPVPPLPPLHGTVPAFVPPPPTLSSEDVDFIHTNSEVSAGFSLHNYFNEEGCKSVLRSRAYFWTAPIF